MILEVNEIHSFYQQSHILFGVTFSIEEGEAAGLLGRNGAGKTTTIKSIIGLVPPRSGTIKFKEEEITHRPPHEKARLGIGYVPEDRRIFSDLTVRENLNVAVKRIKGPSSWTLERVFDLFPIIKRRLEQDGITLSGGEQQMLTIARSLMGNPSVLLLDEPSEGLAPLVVRDIRDQLVKLKESGMTMLLAEHSTALVYRVCDCLYLMGKGVIGWSGTPDQLEVDKKVKQDFLGV
jgi:branched-chain amino acid transport system ATP-binding protein